MPMRRYQVVSVLLSSMVAIVPADQLRTAGEPYPTADAVWQVSPEGPRLTQLTDRNGGGGMLSAPLEVTFTDGKSGQQLRGQSRRLAYTPDSAARFEQLLGQGLRVEHVLTTGKGMVTWRLAARNDGVQEAWLQVDFNAPTSLRGPLGFWDGRETRQPLTAEAGHETIDGTFPVSALYNTSGGLALGVSPDSLISCLSTRATPAGLLSYGTRLAIPAGQSAAVTFALFTFKPHFGHLDAIGGYQQRFPEAYAIATDVDPRLTIAGSDTLATGFYDPARVKPEDMLSRATKVRSGYGSWYWGYAPFRRVGDWLGRPELWDWPMDAEERERVEKRAVSTWFDLMDAKRFRETRTVAWHNSDLRHNTATAFYLINWIEENLVKQLDAERFVYNYAEAGPKLRWVTGTSSELHVFPWATPYEETVRRDVPELIRELNLHGFAIDIASNPSLFRGELQRYVPGWAYDKQGKYLHTGVGNRLLLDYLRSQRNEGFRMAIVGNGGGELMVAGVCDTFLTEAKDQPNLHYEKFRQWRYAIGSKPMHLHSGGGFDNPALQVDWPNLSPEQIQLFYQDHLNKWLLGCWQGGYVPSVSHVFGRESVSRAMPALLDVMGRGYQCVPACQGEPKLARARYGQGLQSVLALSNPTTEALSGDEEVLGAYLRPDATVLPVNYYGDPVDFTTAGTSTRVKLSLPRHHTQLVCLPVALQATDRAALSLSGQSSAQITADSVLWRWSLQSPVARQVRVVAEPPSDFTLAEIRLDGRLVTLDTSLSLPAGKHELTVTCTSRLFRSPESALLTFPYEQAQVRLPEQPHPREQAAAQMLADFLACHEPDSTAAGPAVIAIGSGQETGVTLSATGPTLTISGNTPFETQQHMGRLLRLLMARKYGFVPPFAEHLPLQPTRDMLAKAGVTRANYFAYVETAGQEIPGPMSQARLLGAGVLRARVAKPTHSTGMSAGFVQDETVYAWAVKGPIPARYGSISIYVNSDDQPSGREAVAGGTDWILSGAAGKPGLRLVRYGNIPANADGQTTVANSKTREVAQYEGGIVLAGDVAYVLIKKELLAALPPNPKHRFYVLAYDKDQTNARATYLAQPDATEVIRPVLDMTVYAADAPPPPNPTLQLPTVTEPLKLDGKLDEGLWRQAALIEHLRPLRGGSLREPTEALVCFTADALLLGFRCWESQLQYLGTKRFDRDDDRIWMGADHLEIFLAPGVAEQATAYPFYQLMVTPSGSQWDAHNLETSWNGDWQTASYVGDHYWSAEVRIPLAALTGAATADTWRANVARFRAVNREWGTWSPVQGGLQKPSSFGIWIRRLPG